MRARQYEKPLRAASPRERFRMQHGGAVKFWFDYVVRTLHEWQAANLPTTRIVLGFELSSRQRSVFLHALNVEGVKLIQGLTGTLPAGSTKHGFEIVHKINTIDFDEDIFVEGVNAFMILLDAHLMCHTEAGKHSAYCRKNRVDLNEVIELMDKLSRTLPLANPPQQKEQTDGPL